MASHGSLAVRQLTLGDLPPPPRAQSTHDHAVLVLQLKGRTSVVHRGRFNLVTGDVQIIPAGDPHQVVKAEGSVLLGIELCPACFTGSDIAPLLAPIERVRAGGPPVVHLPEARQEHVQRLIEELRVELVNGAPEVITRSLLALILFEIARASASVPSVATPDLVGEALSFIEKHCRERISLREVAAALHRSPAYLTTLMKKTTGKSAVEWITSARLSEARALLLQSDEHIDIIAERVGYADATHFIRLFRRAHGVTPAAWRGLHKR